MRSAFFLLVLLICIVAYVRAKQPATWDSWMTALGQDSFAVPVASSDSNAPVDSAAPTAPPPPARVPQVGGLIKDGDFPPGSRYWEGNGTAAPLGKGLVVTLNPSAWTRVYQTFSGDQGTLYSIEVTYKLSPGLTVSKDPADYANISKSLQIPGFEVYSSLHMTPGEFYGTIGDPSSNRMTCEVYSPKLGSTEVQDYQHTYATIPPMGNNTFALAFPPGNGTVTLITAYVTNR